MKTVTVALILVISVVLFTEVTSANEISVTTHDIGAALGAVRLALPSTTPAAGAPVRIRFATGTIAATRTGHLAPLASDLFVLAAQRGQTLEAFVESPGALLTVWGPDGDELSPGAEQMPAWRVVLPAKGDHFIAVNSTGRATSYKLTVIIDTPNAAGATRIRFATGSTSATVSGQITAGAPARYVLRALADQMLMVNASATRPGLLYCVAGADGRVVIPFSAGPGAWRPVLPATQDYTIVLVSPDAAAAYTMTVFASPLRPAPTPQPSRIQFPPGATSAKVSGSLAQGTPARYVAWAARGQRMEIRIWPAPTAYVPPRTERHDRRTRRPHMARSRTGRRYRPPACIG